MHLDKVHKGYLYLGIFLVLIGALGAIGPKESIPLIWLERREGEVCWYQKIWVDGFYIWFTSLEESYSLLLV